MFENILIHIYSIDLKIILLKNFIVILIIISFTIFYFKTAKNLRSIRNLIIILLIKTLHMLMLN